MRRKAKTVDIGGVKIGGEHPIVIQSMTNTDTRDIEATVAQIHALQNAGCEIVRVAVLDEQAARCIAEIKEQISIPLVADIHFDYRLALLSLEQGVDKLRINPGNIGGEERVRAVVEAAQKRGVPIRVGVNAGSLEKWVYEKYQGVTAQGLVDSAMSHVALLEKYDFEDIVVSIKGDSIPLTVQAHEIIAGQIDYPIHIGITHAGVGQAGMVKSIAGAAALLSRGFGDTLRVSLTDDPVAEIACAREILQAMGLRYFKPEIISCPTCGRCQVDLISLAKQVEKRLEGVDNYVKVAVMGCVVNGPGEARDADVGIAAGKGAGLVFSKGEIIAKVPEERLLDALMDEIEKHL